MTKPEKYPFPRWAFAIIAVGGLVASGIYLGIMSIEGFTNLRITQAVSFGILGLLMFWGALFSR